MRYLDEYGGPSEITYYDSRDGINDRVHRLCSLVSYDAMILLLDVRNLVRVFIAPAVCNG